MRITIKQLLNCVPALNALVSQPHRGEVAFRVRRLAQKVNDELPAANAARDGLFTAENSTQDETGARTLKPEYVLDFSSSPLFDEVIDIDAKPLTAVDLADAMITPLQIDQLGPLVASE